MMVHRKKKLAGNVSNHQKLIRVGLKVKTIFLT